jgi:predicted dehydrogenase
LKTSILIAGTGFMAVAYAEVLRELGVSALAVGRSDERARAFTERTGVPAVAGGIEQWLSGRDALPERAIVCTSLGTTVDTVRLLLDAGLRSLLIEKPGAVCADDLAVLARQAEAVGAHAYVGYNRRFFESVRQARARIAAEGGATSVHFEFTERERDATSGKFDAVEQRHWGLANSSHVIDLAFHLAGRPATLQAQTAGALPWHPGGARFAGSGVTQAGVLFSYCANWGSGGRWGVEVCTEASRLILKPLEKVQVQPRGRFDLSELPLDTDLDTRFKPGIHRQTRAFLEGEDREHLVMLAEQAEFARTCSTMCGESFSA